MASGWKDLAKFDVFNKDTTKAVEQADTLPTVVLEEANMTDRFVINATDGRKINVIVDNASRTVYPVRRT